MTQFTATQAFNIEHSERVKHEIMARMQCYRVLGLELAKLDRAVYSVEYRVEIIHHEYLAHMRYVKITAEVQ